ncbi:hypothetical protein [Massilia sp. PWRC2]|uniref:hypothetical protein n=1 Tax=Massilia sp. PWRC2 TaxID=2804626 RepID=UPI003CF11E0E
MRYQIAASLLTIELLLSGCAAVGGPPPQPGETVDAVVARLGRPTATYALAIGEEYEYARGPFGQQTYMARFGADRRLRSFEQVLTGETFATIKLNSATHEDVLRTVGRPAETSRVRLNNYEVWSYRYKEAGVWNSMMHVHFDEAGIVRLLQNGPDPMYDERRFMR